MMDLIPLGLNSTSRSILNSDLWHQQLYGGIFPSVLLPLTGYFLFFGTVPCKSQTVVMFWKSRLVSCLWKYSDQQTASTTLTSRWCLFLPQFDPSVEIQQVIFTTSTWPTWVADSLFVSTSSCLIEWFLKRDWKQVDFQMWANYFFNHMDRRSLQTPREVP